jgi:serine protease
MRNYVLFLTTLALVILGCMDFSDSPSPPPPQPAPVAPPGGGGPSGPGISGTLTLFQGSGVPGSPAHFSAAAEAMVSTARASQRGSSPPHIVASATPPSSGIPVPRPALGATVGWSTHTPERVLLPGEIIVRTEEVEDPPALLARVRTPGLRAEHLGFATRHLHLVRFLDARGEALDVAASLELASELGARAGIRFAEVNALQFAFAAPNDTYYAYQWHYPAMNLPAAWDVTQGSAATVVAVVDTGIVPHPDLSQKLVPGADLISDVTRAGDGNGRDNDPTDMGGDLPNGQSSWHGTHVAGTVGAHSNNGAGVAGVSWATRILPVRVLGKGGGTLFDIAAGMAWAYGAQVPGVTSNANPAQVVNLSLGGGGSDPSPTYQDVIDAGVNQGVVFVIAAGNSNENAAKTIPCNQANVICVGATRISGSRSSFSNFGSVVDVMAPGGELSEDVNGDGFPDGILSTVRNAQGQATWDFQQGTSMAAPHVAGLVALMKARSAGLNHAQVEQILKSSANPGFTCSEGCGAGLVNAHAAVLAAGGQSATGPAKLVVTTTELFLSGTYPEGAIQVVNTGGASLSLTATATGTHASALGFSGGNLLTLPGGQSGVLKVRADLAALPTGTHQVTVSLASDAGNGQVAVRMRAGAAQDKDAIVVAVYQDGEDWKAGGDTMARASAGHRYDLNLTPGTYFVVAAVDEDGDGEFFEEGEPVGIFPLTSSPEPIEVPENTRMTGADFALIPYKSIEGGGGGGSVQPVGGPCASNADCQSNDCIDAWPGGYCSQVCSASCPAGSTCYTLNTSSGPVSVCLANCPAPGGGQSTCRASYVCYPDDIGTGYCWPRCTSSADCAGSCNTGTGYCQ